MATHRILAQAHPTNSNLDQLIAQMEVTLGKPHSQSPFPALYQKFGFSTTEEKPAQEEEVKETKPAKANEQGQE